MLNDSTVTLSIIEYEFKFLCSWQIISHEIVFNYLSKLCAVRNFVENELNRMGHI